MNQGTTDAVTVDAFEEGYVEADGFRIRYKAAGQGEPLVVLHGAGGMKLYRSHALLAREHRVIVFEAPGFGASAPNERTQSVKELALTMANAVTALEVQSFSLMGNSFGGRLALWMAVQQPERVQALLLVGPAAIRPETISPPQSLPREELIARLYANPELRKSMSREDPEVVDKQQALVSRLRGPARDEELERLMADLEAPVLVMFGTKDKVMPPEMGRLYCEILPNCHFVLIYDAAHEADADRPEAFASLADDFLRRRQGFLVNNKTEQIHP